MDRKSLSWEDKDTDMCPVLKSMDNLYMFCDLYVLDGCLIDNHTTSSFSVLNQGSVVSCSVVS